MDQSTTLGSSATLRKHGERYLPQFKERVILYAVNHSYAATAKQFHIHHTTVSQWVKQEGQHLKDKQAALSQEETPEKRFQEWLQKCTKNNELSNKDDLISYAQSLIPDNLPDDDKNWFGVWVSRIADNNTKLENNKSHLNYPEWFKRCVCTFATNKGQNEAAKMFAVSRKRIWEWMQGISLQPKVRGCKEGRTVTNKSVDEELVKWVKTEFKDEKLKGVVVRKKAQEMYKAAGCEMACSKGWFAKWCKRHNLTSMPRLALNTSLEEQLLQWMLTKFDRQESLCHAEIQQKAVELSESNVSKFSSSWVMRFCRRHLPLIQQAPEVVESDYPGFMQNEAQAFRISLEHMFFLGCMDEIPLNFATPLQGLEHPIEASQQKSLSLLPKYTNELCQTTLVLSALEDGRLLPPSLILKEGAEELQMSSEDVSELVHVMTQSNAFMDSACFAQWIQDIWFRHVEIPNALVVDCLESHNDMGVRSAMADVSCHLAVMPGGCSTLLQPLHCGGVTAWFTERLKERWAQHVAMLPLSEKPLGPGRKDLVCWIAELYQQAQAPPLQEMIREGFKASGLRPEPIF